MELFHLFITSLMPILKVLLVITVGLFLATDRIDLLGADAKHHLNNYCWSAAIHHHHHLNVKNINQFQANGNWYFVFFPALIGCSLADTITIKDLATLWFMPVNIFISCIIGSGLGWILVIITRTPRRLWGIVISCSSSANLGTMLLIILPTLCEEKNSPFGYSSTCSADGKAYASLSLAMQAIYVWSILYFILRMSANHGNKEIDTNDATIIVKTSVSSNGCSGDVLDQVDLPHQTDNEGNEKISTFGKLKQSFMMVMRSRSLKKIFAPCTIAAIVGFIIGIASPIRKALIGDSAPLRVIYSSAKLIGEAGIPSITLIVGANLLKGLRGSGVGASLIIGIIVIRNILLPAFGIVIVKAAKRFGMVDSDSFYQFTLLLQYAIPPAMNIGTISQMLGTGESEFSVIMPWNYVIAAFSLTLWTAFYMWLVT